MKRKRNFDFLAVTLFAGIILSFTVYVGMSAVFASDDRKDTDVRKGFNEIFYDDGGLAELARFVNYKIFKSVDGADLIIGKNDWLFEPIDSRSGYERLLDYIGESPFSQDELSAIAQAIRQNEKDYADEGISYMLVVIPDAMTVCPDKIPEYLGARSEKARLSQLSAYLAKEGVTVFVDSSVAMNAENTEIETHNNTENSINAYGAYCVYNTVMAGLLTDGNGELKKMHLSSDDFYIRLTEGRYISKLSGLENTVKNRTVSLSDTMSDDYSTSYNEKGTVVTEMSGEKNSGACVVVECSAEDDRIQLMPYFSNTFGKVVYSSGLSENTHEASEVGADLVIQVIREEELKMLLNMLQ